MDKIDLSPLSSDLGRRSEGITVVLFSQDGCGFCAEVRQHYLRPLAAQRPAGVTVAEIERGSTRTVVDWHGARVTHDRLAQLHGVRYAPTVKFFSATGSELAPAIVGLSRDFFGAYLDTRIHLALRAARAAAS